ncbi:hypothetical protein [Mycobacterium sp.]|nr:hypothetical protein [Mycobacterium sp.]HTQ20270.1 hypothetical protein [Mycobacterium sp.]
MSQPHDTTAATQLKKLAAVLTAAAVVATPAVVLTKRDIDLLLQVGS